MNKYVGLVEHADGSVQTFPGYDLDCVGGLALSCLNTDPSAVKLAIVTHCMGRARVTHRAVKGASFARLVPVTQ